MTIQRKLDTDMEKTPQIPPTPLVKHLFIYEHFSERKRDAYGVVPMHHDPQRRCTYLTVNTIQKEMETGHGVDP